MKRNKHLLFTQCTLFLLTSRLKMPDVIFFLVWKWEKRMQAKLRFSEYCFVSFLCNHVLSVSLCMQTKWSYNWYRSMNYFNLIFIFIFTSRQNSAIWSDSVQSTTHATDAWSSTGSTYTGLLSQLPSLFSRWPNWCVLIFKRLHCFKATSRSCTHCKTFWMKSRSMTLTYDFGRKVKV